MNKEFTVKEFSALPLADDGKTLLYEDNEVKQSRLNLSEMLQNKLDTEIYAGTSGKFDNASDVVIANSAIWSTEQDWTDDITAASAYAYEQAIAQIPSPFDPTFLSGEIDKKMDKTFSSNFYPMNENPSGYLTEHQDLSNYATKTYVNEEVGKVGSYVTATLVNNIPDVQNPSNKKIYLTKIDGASEPDLYKEWIYTENSAWECIGDTSLDLSDLDSVYNTVNTNSASWGGGSTYNAGSGILINNDTTISIDSTTTTIKEGPFNGQTGTVTLQGKEYKTVIINNQCWLAQNYDDGSSYIRNDTFGTYYHAYEMPTPPDGWHIATSADWGDLINSINGKENIRKLLSTDLWSEDNVPGTNELKLELKPGGYYYTSFHASGTFATFYTDTTVTITTSTGPQRIYYELFYTPNGGPNLNINSIPLLTSHKNCYPIRLVKDELPDETSGTYIKTIDNKEYIAKYDNENNVITETYVKNEKLENYIKNDADVCKIGFNNYIDKSGISNDSETNNFIQGCNNKIKGACSFVQGYSNIAVKDGLSQGYYNSASVKSFSQGYYNTASNISFAQGSYNTATNNSFAQGQNNTTTNTAFAQGLYNTAANNSFTQGSYNSVNNYSQAFGYGINITNTGMGIGQFNKTSTDVAFVIGNGTYFDNRSDLFIIDKTGNVSALSGKFYDKDGEVGGGGGGQTYNPGYLISIDENNNINFSANNCTAKSYSVAFGFETSALWNYTHSEGYKTLASAEEAHAEGQETSARGKCSHSEGYRTLASGVNSHTEGSGTSAFGKNSHAEGDKTVASGDASHAEGYKTSSYALYSHAEGYITSAKGNCSHTEGMSTYAWGSGAHAEGSGTTALGNFSHAEGSNTKAADNYMFVAGKNNKTSAGALFVIGNGSTTANRSDALVVSSNNKIITPGDYILSGTNNDDVKLSDFKELSTLLQSKPTTGFYTIGCSAGDLVWVNMNA